MLRLEVEDRSLIVLFGRREVKGPASAEVECEAVGCPPVILEEILLDVCARTDLALLQIDLEGIDLTEQEAGERVAAVGYALLIGARCCEGEGAGRDSAERLH